jgi:hypothetical protein
MNNRYCARRKRRTVLLTFIGITVANAVRFERDRIPKKNRILHFVSFLDCCSSQDIYFADKTIWA